MDLRRAEFIAQTATKLAAPLLDHQISLAPLGTSADAGFTAATGAHNAVKDVLSCVSAKRKPPPHLSSRSPKIQKTRQKMSSPARQKGKKGRQKASASTSKAKAKKGKRKGQKRG